MKPPSVKQKPRKNSPWTAWLQERYSAASIASFQADLAAFARWFERTNGDALRPDRLTPTDVRQYRAWLQAQGRKPATINRHLASLRVYVRWAQENGLLDYDPLQHVKGIESQPLAPRWLDRREQAALIREAERILAAARTDTARRIARRDVTLIVLLLNTGLRISEVCALTWDVVTLRSRSGQLAVVGKGDKQRTIPLNRLARQTLAAWRTEKPAAQYVFGNREDRSLNPASAWRRIAKIARRAGLTHVSPHTLRHTFAKNLVNSGVSLEKVAALLGYNNLNTTKIYIPPGQRDLEQAVGKLI